MYFPFGILRRLRLPSFSIICVGLSLGPMVAAAQGSRLAPQSYFRLPQNDPGLRRIQTPSGILDALDSQRRVVYEALWRDPAASIGAATNRDSIQFARLVRILDEPSRAKTDAAPLAPELAKLAPRVQGILLRGRTFRRGLLDVLADTSLDERSRDRGVAELVANYSSRDASVATLPKSADLMDGQLHSLEFRAKYPRLNGVLWAGRWLEQGLYESLLDTAAGNTRQQQMGALTARFRRMIERQADGTPYLLPLSPAVAPTFARRYPNAAAIVDNLNMLEETFADILVSREIPRSAKGREMDLVRMQFQSDTAFVLAVDVWHQRVAAAGVHNMGGETVGFGSAVPVPTVTRGASMAAQMPAEHQHATAAVDSMPGMQHGSMQQGQPTVEQMMAIYNRMIADPVIRERSATDPLLQRLLAAAKFATEAMPGMQHESTHAMPMTPASAALMTRGTPEERKRAIEFIVLLLSDPAVEARIHSYPELHALWSDPEVQRRLTELKKMTKRPPGGSHPPPSH